ncbi:MAG: type II secretion system F family protein [Planctomycetaceae bacterium]|nr:type II secretion system F family protein [Planctomycetaceae bacterium]
MSTHSPMSLPIEPHPSFVGILRQEERFANADDDQFSNRINTGFDRLMIESGIEITPTTVVLLCLYCGVMFGGVTLVIQEDLLTASLGLGLGGVIPLLFVLLTRMRRQQQMTQQLPGMIEHLARAAKAGRSLEQCCVMVAADTPKPLGSEMRICARQVQLGQDTPLALRDLAERTGLLELNLLVTTLSVHQTTGGDLVTVLERLAQTIRDRLLFLGRLKAATIGSRGAAILMLVMPPIIVLFLTVRDPEYLTQLLSTYWGKATTIAAIVLDVIGSAFIFSILRKSQRG